MEQLYKKLHAHPETGGCEYRTAETVTAWLTEKGLSVTRVGETGLIAVLEGGKPGKTVGLRADLDALPIAEQTGLPYRSQTDGVMHACGHDFHTAAVCGTAALLAAKRETIAGRILFLFESDEEGNGGATALADHPLMQHCDAVFGAHIDPSLPKGVFGFKVGSLYAAAATFDITWSGRSTHGATPEPGADALAGAAESVGLLLSLRSHERMCSVGTLHSGTARNIIPAQAEMSGIVRAADPTILEQTEHQMRALLDRLCARHHISYQLCYRPGYAGVVNPAEGTALARAAATEQFGAARVTDMQARFTTEDFGVLLTGRQGSFYHIGIGGDAPLHSPFLAPDPKLLNDAVALHTAVIEKYLLEENI